jgi:hypothetical protein
MRLTAAILATLCAATTTSCLLGDDDDGDGTNYVAITEIEDAYRDAACAHYANCGVFPDKETCLATNLTTTGLSFGVDANIIAAFYEGSVRYNGSNVKECLDALANRSCDKTSESARVTPPACADVLKGTKASGESCLVDEECTSGNCTGESSQLACSPGVCSGDTRPTSDIRMVGESCVSISVCETGAYCDQSTNVCTLFKTQGTTCTQNYECAYGLGCTGPAAARVCDALPGPGETCYITSPTFVQLECRDEGTVCDTSTTMCTQVGGPGMTCNSSTDCSTYYPCNFTTSMCTRGPGLGQACSSSNQCADVGTFCDTLDTFTCVALLGNGETCQQDLQCTSGFCDQTGVNPICAEIAACDF